MSDGEAIVWIPLDADVVIFGWSIEPEQVVVPRDAPLDRVLIEPNVEIVVDEAGKR